MTAPVTSPGHASPHEPLPHAASAPAARTAVELRHASKWYGSVVAVNDVSCALGAGITGLLGPNGAGKTTVLHLMAGLLRPSAGDVLIAGRRAARRPAVYRTLGLVPEREAVHPYLTGWEYVRTSARLHRLPDAEAAAMEAVRTVGLEADRDRLVSTYSKGMRQRIKVAAAIVHDPTVLLLDEPFNGMDPRQRLHMMDVLRDLAAAGRTIVISSHILEELNDLAANVLVMVAGRLAASGDFRAIRRLMTDRPHTVSVRSSDDRRLASALLAHESVSSIEIAAGHFVARASDRRAFARLLPRIARDLGVRLFEIRPTDQSLEDVFSYLLDR